ncbi:MAG: iron-containing alcohol dehydrogenase, partial [Pseudomonadota bacterium]
LPHVLRFNAPEAGVLYAEIAADAFPHLAQIDGTQARCAAFIDALADLASKLGMQTRLRDVDIPEGAIAKLAADAMLQQRLLVNNPRDLSEQDAINIYKAAW